MWFRSIEGVRGVLPLLPKADPIQVGLIDDGVDRYHKTLLPRIVFVDTTSPLKTAWAYHGTTVALAICAVCPEVQISLIAREGSFDAVPVRSPLPETTQVMLTVEIGHPPTY